MFYHRIIVVHSRDMKFRTRLQSIAHRSSVQEFSMLVSERSWVQQLGPRLTESCAHDKPTNQVQHHCSRRAGQEQIFLLFKQMCCRSGAGMWAAACLQVTVNMAAAQSECGTFTSLHPSIADDLVWKSLRCFSQLLLRCRVTRCRCRQLVQSMMRMYRSHRSQAPDDH